MQIYLRVAELSSFTRAADNLGIPKASASTAVQQLETMLGTTLLQRTTRRVRMTPDGQAFYERCKDLLADMDELQTMFQRGDEALSGRIRIDISSGMGRLFLVERLSEFLDLHPLISLELSMTDRLVDLVREGFDCVVRSGAPGDDHLVSRPLGALRVMNCASPGYLERHGTPTSLADLADHRLVHYVSSLGANSPGWEYPDGDGYAWMPMRGALTVNSSEAYMAACLAGLGLIQAPAAGVQPLVDNGQLVEVLADFASEPMLVSLLHAHHRHLPRRVQVFMTWLTEVIAPHLQTPGTSAQAKG